MGKCCQASTAHFGFRHGPKYLKLGNTPVFEIVGILPFLWQQENRAEQSLEADRREVESRFGCFLVYFTMIFLRQTSGYDSSWWAEVSRPSHDMTRCILCLPTYDILHQTIHLPLCFNHTGCLSSEIFSTKKILHLLFLQEKCAPIASLNSIPFQPNVLGLSVAFPTLGFDIM